MMGVQFIPPPPAAITRVLSAFPRDQLEGFIAVAIDLLDLADGDPDREDATDLEDEGLTTRAIAWADHRPGCPVSDSDFEHDGHEESDEDLGAEEAGEAEDGI
jgi:hypothetical protein